MSFHSFADDSQIYDHCLLSERKGKERKRTCIAPIVSISTTKRSDEVYNVVHRLEGLSGIGHWMSA